MHKNKLLRHEKVKYINNNQYIKIKHFFMSVISQWELDEENFKVNQ